MQFPVKDEHSGIGSIEFEIIDTSKGFDEHIYASTQHIDHDASLVSK